MSTTTMAEHIIDAKGEKLGRLASRIAVILQGKDDPGYAPNRVSDNRVVIKNIDGISVSGGKWKNKTYYWHTGYMGHLKSKTLEQEFEKNPQRVLREAVRRMLPQNSLNAKRLKNLVFVEKDGE